MVYTMMVVAIFLLFAWKVSKYNELTNSLYGRVETLENEVKRLEYIIANANINVSEEEVNGGGISNG